MFNNNKSKHNFINLHRNNFNSNNNKLLNKISTNESANVLIKITKIDLSVLTIKFIKSAKELLLAWRINIWKNY